MEDFKEFQGKSLDEAIQGACEHFDAPREKLEIELVQDAKSGIFGVVGARPAMIRARCVQVGGAMPTKPDSAADQPLVRRTPPAPFVRKPYPADPVAATDRNPLQENQEPLRDNLRDPLRDDTFRPRPIRPDYDRYDRYDRYYDHRSPREYAPRIPRTPYPTDPDRRYRPRSPFITRSLEDNDDMLWEDEPSHGPFIPAPPLTKLDQTVLQESVQEVATKIVNVILGETPMQIHILEHRVDIRVDCGENSGLLIGREGQTLTALQYLVSRIVSRRMDAPVRVQFDVGDYRQRQDERVRDMAISLAERVSVTGRPCSTRPMSSYHRRLVHMTLQDMPDIFTRSSGDGPLKRIIIQRRRADRFGGYDYPGFQEPRRPYRSPRYYDEEPPQEEPLEKKHPDNQ